MPAQRRGIVKVCVDQLTQRRRTRILVQIKEELLEPTDLCLRTGVDHIFGDTAGDERHNVVAQHKRGSILAKRSLGVITLLEDSVGPSDLIRTRPRTGTGKEVFRTPWHLDTRSPGCNLVPVVISIIAAKEGGAQESKEARCATDRESTGSNAIDGPLGAGTIYGGGAIRWTSLFHARAKERQGTAVGTRDTQLATKPISAGCLRCWINIPILRPGFCAPTQGFAPMRVLLAAPYHRRTQPLPYLTNVARVPSLSRGMYVMMFIYWFVSLGGGKMGTLCSNLTMQLLPHRINCIIN